MLWILSNLQIISARVQQVADGLHINLQEAERDLYVYPLVRLLFKVIKEFEYGAGNDACTGRKGVAMTAGALRVYIIPVGPDRSELSLLIYCSYCCGSVFRFLLLI